MENKNKISVGQRLLIIIGVLFIIGFFGQTIKPNKNLEEKNNQRDYSEEYESGIKYIECDYCSKSFNRESGVKLMGHSQEFCRSNCAENWAIEHNIRVN
jgi:hypothetical protein